MLYKTCLYKRNYTLLQARCHEATTQRCEARNQYYAVNRIQLKSTHDVKGEIKVRLFTELNTNQLKSETISITDQHQQPIR